MKNKAVSSPVIREIKKVFKLQIETLERLQRQIDGSYDAAIDILSRCRGKVIVTGVGKSGIVAQKIAATMSSTGTAAIYLDASDGMHGDLGIVQRGDVVIAIGKSGESDELNALLPSLKKIGVKIIAITANADSSLAHAASVILHTPIERESCPLNLAPTCSTTAAFVVGDGLAAALMQRKNFKPEMFALYHPGGSLGKRLNLTVADLMRSGRDNPVITVAAPIRTMLLEITRKRTGAVSVVDKNNNLRGLVTDYDIRRAVEQGKNVLKMSVRDIMKPNPSTIYSDEKAVKALDIMENREKPISLLPVLDRKKKVVGMIHLHDLLAKGL